MSILQIVEVRCDGTDTANCPDNAAWNDAGVAVVLRERMREEGWATSLPRGRDRCPTCKAAAQATRTAGSDPGGAS